MTASRLTRLALVAALYVVLTHALTLLAPGLNLSFGPIQIRVSEGLAMLCLFDPLMPLALYVGCLLANLLGGLGIVDILIGPLLTLAAGYATWWLRRWPALPFLPPILFNAFGVAAYLRFLLGIDFGFHRPEGSGIWAGLLGWVAAHPYLSMVLSIGAGQTISVVLFGMIFIRIWKKNSP